VYGQIAAAQREAGDPRAAERTLDELADLTRDEADHGVVALHYAELARTLAAGAAGAGAGDREQYRRLIAKASSAAATRDVREQFRTTAYVAIADAQLAAGDAAGFDRTMAEVRAATEEMGDPFFHGPGAYGDIAVRYVQAGRLAELPAVFDTFAAPTLRAEAAYTTARILDAMNKESARAASPATRPTTRPGG
jgi:hypothetical protein